MFTIVREMEKEVVILDQTPAAAPDPSPMQIEWGQYPPPTVAPMSQERVFKVIKKLDVQILCAQHNPVRVFFVGTNTCSR